MAERLIAARQALGETRSDWMRRYNVVAATLSHWETGKNLPELRVLVKICADNDLSLDWILLGRKPRVRVLAATVPILPRAPSEPVGSDQLQES